MWWQNTFSHSPQSFFCGVAEQYIFRLRKIRFRAAPVQGSSGSGQLRFRAATAPGSYGSRQLRLQAAPAPGSYGSRQLRLLAETGSGQARLRAGPPPGRSGSRQFRVAPATGTLASGSFGSGQLRLQAAPATQLYVFTMPFRLCKLSGAVFANFVLICAHFFATLCGEI